jgi:uncharacterized protein
VGRFIDNSKINRVNGKCLTAFARCRANRSLKIGFDEVINQPIAILQAERIPVGSAVAASQPVGMPVPQQATGATRSAEEIGATIGVWESSPGRFRRQVMQREFSHILSGSCTFHPDGCNPVRLHGGDAILFPADCKGEWEIHESLRKIFVLF